MARARMIANAICADKKIHQLSDDTSRLAFTWLVTFADAEGRTYGDPAMVRSMLFPRRDDVTVAKMEGYIREWAALGLVEWYQSDGDWWISFPAFGKNQPGLRRDHEPKSNIPAPPDVRATDVQDTYDIRTTDGTLPAQVKLREEKIREGNQTPDNCRAQELEPSSSPIQPPEDDDPLVQRMIQHDITYDMAYKLISGQDELAAAWLDYVDTHPGIPNRGAYLTKHIRLKKPPPSNGTGPPGAPKLHVTGLSEADLEWQREHERAKAAQKRTADRAGPAAPA